MVRPFVCGLHRQMRRESVMPCVMPRKPRALAGKGLVLLSRGRLRRAPHRTVPIRRLEREIRLRLLLRELPLAGESLV